MTSIEPPEEADPVPSLSDRPDPIVPLQLQYTIVSNDVDKTCCTYCPFFAQEERVASS